MAEVASAYVSLLPSARGFGSKIQSEIGSDVDKAGKSMGKRFGGAIGTATKTGLLIGGVAFAAFAKSAIGASSDAQQSLGATETVFERFAKTVVKTSDEAATQYGLSANEYRENANLLGSLFKNQGVDLDQLAGKTEAMIATASDLAATFGGKTSDAVEALGAAFKGEFDTIERYGISIKQSDVNARLAAEGQDELTGAALKQAQQIATTDLIMQQATQTQGAFARESDTLAGAQQRLSAQWENVKAQVGNALLPVLTSLVTFVSEDLLPALTGIWEALAPAREAIANFAEGVETIFGLIRDRDWGAAWETLKVGTVSALTTVRDQAKEFIVGRILPAVVSAIASVKSRWANAWGRFYEDPDKAYLATIRRTRSFGRELGVEVSIISAKMLLQWRDLFSQFPEIAGRGGARTTISLAQGLRAMPPLARSIAIDTGIQLVRGLSNMPSGATDVAVRVVAGMRRGLSAMPGMAKGIATAAVSAMTRAMANAASLLYAAGQQIVQGLINGIKSMASAAAGAAISVVNDAVSGAKGALGIRSPSRVFHEIGMWSMRGFADGISGNKQKVLDALEEMQSQLQSRISSIRSDFGSLSESVASAFAPGSFDAVTGQDFLRETVNRGYRLRELASAFKQLRSWGLSAGFLSQLFQSGNTELVLSLASGPRSDARMAATAFGSNERLSRQLGESVARNQYGPQLDRAVNELRDIKQAIKGIGPAVGKELKQQITAGARSR